MAEVSVTISGRQFRLSCESGEEDHVADLARELDARIDALRAKFGEVGDMRLSVMAALTVSDELACMAVRIKRLEEEIAAVRNAQAAAADRSKSVQAAVAAALDAAAERVESIARKLNRTVGSGVALG